MSFKKKCGVTGLMFLSLLFANPSNVSAKVNGLNILRPQAGETTIRKSDVFSDEELSKMNIALCQLEDFKEKYNIYLEFHPNIRSYMSDSEGIFDNVRYGIDSPYDKELRKAFYLKTQDPFSEASDINYDGLEKVVDLYFSNQEAKKEILSILEAVGPVIHRIGEWDHWFERYHRAEEYFDKLKSIEGILGEDLTESVVGSILGTYAGLSVFTPYFGFHPSSQIIVYTISKYGYDKTKEGVNDLEKVIMKSFNN